MSWLWHGRANVCIFSSRSCSFNWTECRKTGCIFCWWLHIDPPKCGFLTRLLCLRKFQSGRICCRNCRATVSGFDHWRVLSVDSWYLNRGSSFLLASFTLKVYVAPIAMFHTLEGGVSLGKHMLVSHFLHKTRWLGIFLRSWKVFQGLLLSLGVSLRTVFDSSVADLNVPQAYLWPCHGACFAWVSLLA